MSNINYGIVLQSILLCLDDDIDVELDLLKADTTDAMLLPILQSHLQNLQRVHLQMQTTSKAFSKVRSWVFPTYSNFWEKTVDEWPGDTFEIKFRMSKSTFKILVDRLSPYLEKMNTNMRESIPVHKRVAISLYFLASGAQYSVVADVFGVGVTTVREIVQEFCCAVTAEITEESTFGKDIQEQSARFYQFSYVPGCVGVIDGTHFRIPRPVECRSEDYYCYKKFYSILSLLCCDDKKKFTYFQVGHPGKRSDGGAYKDSILERAVNSLPSRYFVLADNAFSLSDKLIKPFNHEESLTNRDKRLFNYRVCATRMIIEQSIGLLKNRFKVLFSLPIRHVDIACDIITTCILLHNFLVTNNDHTEIELIDVENEDPTGGNGEAGENNIPFGPIRQHLLEFFKAHPYEPMS